MMDLGMAIGPARISNRVGRFDGCQSRCDRLTEHSQVIQPDMSGIRRSRFVVFFLFFFFGCGELISMKDQIYIYKKTTS